MVGRWKFAAAMAATACTMGPVSAGEAGVAGPPDPTRPVTLEDAVQEAIRWHPAISAATGTLAARTEDIRVARTGYLPQFSAGVGSGYDSRVSGTWRPRPQVAGSQMLFDFGKVGSAVDAARAGSRQGRAELLLAVDTLARDTGYAVIEIQRNRALEQVAREQIIRVGEISDLVDARFDRGAATRSDALQARARVEAATATAAQIDADRRRWTSNLTFLLGRDTPPAAVGADVPEWLPRSCAVAQPELETIPAVMVAEAQHDRAAAELRRSRADRLPTFALGGDASTDIASPFRGNRSIYNLGLNVTGNVFGGSATRARVRGAGYALEAADAARTQARMETRQRLAEAQQQIGSLRSLLATLDMRRRDMTDTGKLYRLQYLQMGTRTLVDLLNAEQELHQVRFDAVNIEHDLRRLELDCLFYTGRVRDAFGLTGETVRGVTL